MKNSEKSKWKWKISLLLLRPRMAKWIKPIILYDNARPLHRNNKVIHFNEAVEVKGTWLIILPHIVYSQVPFFTDYQFLKLLDCLLLEKVFKTQSDKTALKEFTSSRKPDIYVTQNPNVFTKICLLQLYIHKD